MSVLFSSLFAIWLLHSAALLSPGPNVILVSQLGASKGFISSFYAAVGIAIGAFFWATSAVVGVNTVFTIFPQFRLLLQIIGGAYLIYIATKLWRSGIGEKEESLPLSTKWAMLRLGLITNITNPKAALFFGSVLATSLPANPGIALQVSAILLLVINSLIWHIALGIFFSHERVRNGYAKTKSFFSKLSGLILGGFGFALLVQSIRESR